MDEGILLEESLDAFLQIQENIWSNDFCGVCEATTYGLDKWDRFSIVHKGSCIIQKLQERKYGTPKEVTE